MPEQTPKPENIPSYEDVEKELGMDLMSFMSEMLSEPDDTEKEEASAAPVQELPRILSASAHRA